MIRRDPVSKACDIYSYGVLIWEILTQQQPFSHVKPKFLVVERVLHGEVGNTCMLARQAYSTIIIISNVFVGPCTMLLPF